MTPDRSSTIPTEFDAIRPALTAQTKFEYEYPNGGVPVSHIAETSFQGNPANNATDEADYEFPTADSAENGLTLLEPEPGAVTVVDSGGDEADYEFPTAGSTENGLTLPEPGTVTFADSGGTVGDQGESIAALAAELDDYNNDIAPSRSESIVSYSQASATGSSSSDYMVVNLSDNAASSVPENRFHANTEYMAVKLTGNDATLPVLPGGAGIASVRGDFVAETRFDVDSPNQHDRPVTLAPTTTTGQVEGGAGQASASMQDAATRQEGLVPPSDILRFTLADIGKRCKAGSSPGIIRFVGMHAINGLPRVGVELDAPRGKNNGTVKGDKYFECTAMHGMLCKPDRIVLIDTDSDASALGIELLAGRETPAASAIATRTTKPAELQNASETDAAINQDGTEISRPSVGVVGLLHDEQSTVQQAEPAANACETPSQPLATSHGEGVGVGRQRQVDVDGAVNKGAAAASASQVPGNGSAADDATPEVHSERPLVLNLGTIGSTSTDDVPAAEEGDGAGYLEINTDDPDNAAESNSIWAAAGGTVTADGLMSAGAVADHLKASGLSKAALRTVWSGAKATSTTKSSPGTMNREEFGIACRLAIEAGGQLP
jgi:hypothetical protein